MFALTQRITDWFWLEGTCKTILFQPRAVSRDTFPQTRSLQPGLEQLFPSNFMVTFYRQKQLEDILVLAKQFHETTEPVSDWLSVTEKKLANSEPIGTQTAKIQQQISRHKVGPVQEQDGGGWSQVPLQWCCFHHNQRGFWHKQGLEELPREGCKP